MNQVTIGSDGIYDRPEYVLHTKLKNNLLLSRILERAKNVNAFCVAYGLDAGHVGELVNLKRRAVGKLGEWSKLALTLSDIFFCDPGDLFTEEQRQLELKTNTAFIAMTESQVNAMRDPMREIETREVVEQLIDRAKLTPRQRLVLKLRFNDDKTLEEVGEVLDVQKERIRQIEAYALRRLRLAASGASVDEDDAVFGLLDSVRECAREAGISVVSLPTRKNLVEAAEALARDRKEREKKEREWVASRARELEEEERRRDEELADLKDRARKEFESRRPGFDRPQEKSPHQFAAFTTEHLQLLRALAEQFLLALANDETDIAEGVKRQVSGYGSVSSRYFDLQIARVLAEAHEDDEAEDIAVRLNNEGLDDGDETEEAQGTEGVDRT